MTRLTYLERRWPDSPTFQQIADRWCQDQSFLLLELVWKGFDRLVADDLNEVPFSDNDEAREESLNHLLAIRIDQCKSGDEPFCVQHQPPEQTKRKRGKGRSPQPDIGFVLYSFPRSVWPLEGKILVHEEDVHAYLKEINDNFLTGRYATFSAEGAMLGYLSCGNPERTFSLIDEQLQQPSTRHPRFPDRPHRITNHQRDNLPHPCSPARFTCHHLLLSVAASTSLTEE